MAELSSLLGEMMIPGMLITAGYNSLLAATTDYDEKCARVGDYNDAINQFSGFTDQMTAKWGQLTAKIQSFNNNVSKQTYELNKVIKTSNISNQKMLHRTRITTTLITSLISLLLMIKLYVKQL
jgi:hypothetical protein